MGGGSLIDRAPLRGAGGEYSEYAPLLLAPEPHSTGSSSDSSFISDISVLITNACSSNSASWSPAFALAFS